MAVKNSLLLGLTHLFSSSKNRLRDPERPKILVVSTTGLGDSLWGTPAFRAIKARFQESHLAVLTSPIGKALFEHNPYINTIYTVTHPAFASCIKLFYSLRKERFEIALIFHVSQRPILPLVALCSPSKVIGNRGMNKGLDSLLTHPIEKSTSHEIERRLEIAKTIGVIEQGPHMEIFLKPEEREEIQNFLQGATFPIGIHPGAKDRFKQWDPSHFAQLGKRLQKEYDAQIFVTGNAKERLLTEKIAAAIPNARSVAGKLSIRSTAALIGELKLFLTNDTGPMHIAYAMKTPTFSLFTPTHFSTCGPYHVSQSSWIQKSPTCYPCLKKKCLLPFCFEQISEEEVWTRVKKFMAMTHSFST